MTNEEAIETLKVAKSEIEWEYPMDYQVALDKAIKALEKEPISETDIILTREEYGELVSSEYDNGYAKGYEEALEQEPYKDFCEFVAKMVLRDDFEENAGANAEFLCRKLSKLGIVKTNEDAWVLVESEDEK